MSQADKLQTIINAANVEDVEAIWTTLFAKVRLFFESWHAIIRETTVTDATDRHLTGRTLKICF